MRISQEERNQFEHAGRQYYLRCAKDALPLAPLPEFKHALDVLEWYDRKPTKTNRRRVMKMYRSLRKGDRNSSRAYGYSAVGCFYDGLICILARTLFHSDEVCSSPTVYFSEAYYCAARDLVAVLEDISLIEKARRLANDRYWKIHDELFPREEKEAA